MECGRSAGTAGRSPGRGAAVDTLWDGDARVRWKAAWALGMLGIPGTCPPAETYRIEREDARETIQEAMEMIKQVMAGNLK